MIRLSCTHALYRTVIFFNNTLGAMCLRFLFLTTYTRIHWLRTGKCSRRSF